MAAGVYTARMFMKHPEAEDAGCLQRASGRERDVENHKPKLIIRVCKT